MNTIERKSFASPELQRQFVLTTNEREKLKRVSDPFREIVSTTIFLRVLE